MVCDSNRNSGRNNKNVIIILMVVITNNGDHMNDINVNRLPFRT